MKYDLKVITTDDPKPYEVFNLTWYALSKELEDIGGLYRKLGYSGITSVEITKAEEG